MGIIILFVLSQTYADTTWPMYGATLENTHYQKMVGAMNIEPIVKWFYVAGGAAGSIFLVKSNNPKNSKNFT